MDFPDRHFPINVCRHPGCRRIEFAEYGSFSQVDCHSQENGIKCHSQKGMGCIKNLGANLPPLPLYNKSLSECHTIQDHILGLHHYDDAIQSAKHIVNVSRHLLLKGKDKKFLKKLEDCKNKIGQCIAEPTESQHWTSLNNKLPAEVKDVFKNYVGIAEAPNENCLKGFNQDFHQGLLCHKHYPDSTVLFHAAGDHFRDICVTDVSRKDEGIPQGIHSAKITLDEPIFQLGCSQQGLLCARQENQCVVLKYDESNKCIKEHVREPISSEKLHGVEFSPYINNELLVSSKQGQVCLWNFDSGSRFSFQKVAKSDSPLPWSSCHFGGHPRQIVVSDCFSMEMFDHRDNYRKGVELFHLSDQWVKSHERVMASAFLGYPYHLVATDFTLFLVDQRFPNNPVLHWSTQAAYPSAYIKSCKLFNGNMSANKDGSDHFIFLGTQQPAEVVCYPLHLDKGCPPVTTTLPWSVGKIGDFVHNENTSYQPLWSEVEKRFQSSLAGMTVVAEARHDVHVVSVYQMDGYGDIYFQDIKLLPTMDGDGNYSLIPPFEEEKAAGDRRATHFLSSFDERMLLSKQQLSSSSSLELDSEKSLTYFDVENLLAKKSVPPNTGELKNAGVSLSKFHKMACHASKESPLDAVKKLDLKGPNTRLLLALKDNEDIDDVLFEREEDHGRKKRDLRKAYWTNKEKNEIKK